MGSGRMRALPRAMTRIRTVAPSEATGELAEAFEDILRARGAVANLHAALSLRPASLRAFLALDTNLLHSATGVPALSRRERELVALVTSHANRDAYAFTHHADAFSRHVHEPGVVALVASGAWKGRLDPREEALADFAHKLALEPHGFTAADLDALRAAGLTDEEVLDATLIAAHVSFVNRVSLALGVGREDVNAGFRY